MDVWRSAYFFSTAVKWLSKLKKRHQNCLMSSIQLFYSPCLQLVAHLLAVFWECAAPPRIHPTSRYVIAVSRFYKAFPMLVCQATNAGVRRPGYKAKCCPQQIHVQCTRSYSRQQSSFDSSKHMYVQGSR